MRLNHAESWIIERLRLFLNVSCRLSEDILRLLQECNCIVIVLLVSVKRQVLIKATESFCRTLMMSLFYAFQAHRLRSKHFLLLDRGKSHRRSMTIASRRKRHFGLWWKPESNQNRRSLFMTHTRADYVLSKWLWSHSCLKILGPLCQIIQTVNDVANIW